MSRVGACVSVMREGASRRRFVSARCTKWCYDSPQAGMRIDLGFPSKGNGGHAGTRHSCSRALRGTGGRSVAALAALLIAAVSSACAVTATNAPFDDAGDAGSGDDATGSGSDASSTGDSGSTGGGGGEAGSDTGVRDVGSGGGVCDAPGTIFSSICAGAGCHNPTDRANMLDLVSSGVAARLVDHAAFGGPGKLIDSMNPAQSVILGKISSTPPFGSRMPFNLPPLGAAQAQCVHDWVFAQVGAAGGG